MGALHQGHISLIEEAKHTCDVVVCSIFVNPTQFNDKKDFGNYPITLDQDLAMLRKAGCDFAFTPGVSSVYPKNLKTELNLDLGYVGSILEGKFRPGHFDGVVQVVKRLLDVVNPDILFLGEKDYQQCVVIETMIKHFGLPVKVIKGKTIRESDGLAMSSRNRRLNKEARQAALLLSKSMDEIIEKACKQPIKELINYYYSKLNEHPLISVEYLEIADSIGLKPVSKYEKGMEGRLLIAAYVGGVRLIDNKAIHNFVL